MVLIKKEDLQIRADLQTCYNESRCLISLLNTARTNKTTSKHYDLTHHEVDPCFVNKKLWIPTKQATGHCKFKHKITHVIVEYQGHNSHKGQDIDPRIQEQIVNQTQKHLNILCNDIFCYEANNWKAEPKYDQALANYKVFSSAKTC